MMRASPAAPSVRRVRSCMLFSPGGVALEGEPLLRRLIPLLYQICFDQGAQFRGDFGSDAEPQREAPNRLMQQHSKPVGGLEAALAGRGKQSGFERGINEIRNN